MRRHTVILTLASVAVAVGCGLVSGLDSLNVGGEDGSSVDGSGADVVLVQCDGGCGYSIPPGFTLVTFGNAPPSSCPDGTTAQTALADPTVAQDACSCKCTMTTKATCSAANVQLLVNDGGFTCPTFVTNLLGTAGCHTTNLALASSTRVDSKAAGVVLVDAGACGTSEVADASTLQTTTVQVCIPSSCAASASLCTPPSGQRLCAASVGDVTCPAPFTEKHVIGSDAGVACSNCSSDCSINAQNCDFSEHLTLYEDTACTTGSQNASSCTSIGGATTFKSYDFSLTSSGGCTTTATSSASTTLAGQQTVCCLP